MKKTSKFKKPLDQRLWDRVDVKGPNDCWEWRGHKHHKGAGQIGLGGRSHGLIYAHALAWMIDQGRPVPTGMLVCHRCDNPPCCNPDHLFIGTIADNNADKVNKGRQSKGEQQSHLKEWQVHEIRRLCASGVGHKQVALQFQLSRSAIGLIARRERWKHL